MWIVPIHRLPRQYAGGILQQRDEAHTVHMSVVLWVPFNTGDFQQSRVEIDRDCRLVA